MQALVHLLSSVSSGRSQRGVFFLKEFKTRQMIYQVRRTPLIVSSRNHPHDLGPGCHVPDTWPTFALLRRRCRRNHRGQHHPWRVRPGVQVRVVQAHPRCPHCPVHGRLLDCNGELHHVKSFKVSRRCLMQHQASLKSRPSKSCYSFYQSAFRLFDNN